MLPSKHLVSPCSSSTLDNCLLPYLHRSFAICQCTVTSVLLNLVLTLLQAVPLEDGTLLIDHVLPPQRCNLASPYHILSLGQLTLLLLMGRRLKP